MEDELDLFGWVAGTVDGKYRVDEVVGRGGFGVVYRAHHLGFEQTVALKCLRVPKTLTAAERERFRETFLAEGRLLHQLSRATAGIVQALDMGAAVSPNKHWTPYLVLEWLDGRPLDRDFAERRASNQGGRSIGESVKLLASAGRALAVAHSQGIAHRDIKPANLFIANVGTHNLVKILDFGIAKVMAESESVTRAFEETGASLQAFTARYGAPEQFSRRYGATGPWTDVFALALVFVEAVRGTYALDGSDAAQLFVASADPGRRPTLRGFGDEAPEPIEAVLRRALAVDPRERYPNAGEFWPALELAAREAGLTTDSSERIPLVPVAGAAAERRGSFSDASESKPLSYMPIGADSPTSTGGQPSPASGPSSANVALANAATELSSSTNVPSAASSKGAPRRTSFGRILALGLSALAVGAGATLLVKAATERGLGLEALSLASSKEFTRDSAELPRSPEASAAPAPPPAPAPPKASAPTHNAPGPAPEASAAQRAASVPPGLTLPLAGLPQRDVSAGAAGDAFVGGFRVLARAAAFGLDFGTAVKECTDVGLSLCTESQWARSCEAFPEIAKTATWTSSVRDGSIVIRGGESCASTGASAPSERVPTRFALCCGRAVAVRSGNLQNKYLASTADRVAAIERALNQHNVQALLDLSEPTVVVDEEPKTQARLKALIEKDFAAAPDLMILNDICDVAVQAKKVTKRSRRKRRVVYETQGWTADCVQTAVSGDSVASRSVTYSFSAQSKLREIVTKPAD